MDHFQNDYLGNYFSNKINKDVFKLKHSLEIVQSFLSICEITSSEPDYDLHVIDLNQDNDKALIAGEDFVEDEEDPDTWDAFRDAHKFEMLN